MTRHPRSRRPALPTRPRDTHLYAGEQERTPAQTEIRRKRFKSFSDFVLSLFCNVEITKECSNYILTLFVVSG